MKVMWVLDFLPPVFSGRLGLAPQASGSWAVSLLAALPKEGLDLVLCSFSPELSAPRRERIDGVSYLGLPAGDRPALEQALAEEKPDLIQLFGTENDHAPWVLEGFDPQKVLVYIQGLAGPCGEHMADGLPPRFLRRQPLKEALARRTGGLTVLAQKERLLARGERERAVLAKARHILGRTDWDKAYCAAAAPEAEYHHLPEIMRPVFYPGGWQRQSARPHRLFVSQGNIPLKGLHRAIEALAQLAEQWPDAQLYVAGWPPPDKGPLLRPLVHWLAEYPGYLDSLARHLGVQDRIHYTGVLNAEGMRQQFLLAETYLLCSSIENSPNSLGEAMLTGVPCAAAAVGGVPSMLSEKEGELFDPAAPGEMAKAVAALWADPAMAEEKAAAARARALAVHDPKAVAAALLDLYRRLCPGG